MPYSERRPYVVADTLDQLTGPTSGTVTLPHHIDWSGSPAFNLDEPGELSVMYKTVLLEASNLGDLQRWLNGGRLEEVWPALWLPPKVRRLWEARFPELATARASRAASGGGR